MRKENETFCYYCVYIPFVSSASEVHSPNLSLGSLICFLSAESPTKRS